MEVLSAWWKGAQAVVQVDPVLPGVPGLNAY